MKMRLDRCTRAPYAVSQRGRTDTGWAPAGATSPQGQFSPRILRHHHLLRPNGQPVHQTLDGGYAPSPAPFRRCALGAPMPLGHLPSHREEGRHREGVCPRCCGLDVQKKTVVACLLSTEPGQAVRNEGRNEGRTFPTRSADLLDLADWRPDPGCTQVAMESTGVSWYWRPISHRLADAFTVLVVNAQHRKAVPGRTTDGAEGEWIADLLRQGLLRASFIPPRPPRDLRELTRSRTALRDERVAEGNRLQKTWEGATSKLASVVSDSTGKSGHEMRRALGAGTTEAASMAQWARGVLRQKIPQVQRALAGQFSAHHRFLLAQQVAPSDALDRLMEQVGEEIAPRRDPHAAGPPRGGAAAVADAARRRPAHCRGHLGRDRQRYEPLSQCGPPRLLGRPGSGQPGECGQAAEWAYPHRQPVGARGLGRGRAGGRTDETSHLQRGAVSSSGRTTGSQTRGGGGGAFAGDHDRPHVAAA